MLNASAIADALGVPVGRVYRALGTPVPLHHTTQTAGRKGGGQTKQYDIASVVARLRQHFDNVDSTVVTRLYEAAGYNPKKENQQ